MISKAPIISEPCRPLTADEAVHALTLALLYLSRISNSKDPAHYWDVTNYKAYKASTNLDPKILSWLEEVGFVSRHSASANSALGHTDGDSSSLENTADNKANITITPDGVHRAREILLRLGIKDWDASEILDKASIQCRHNILSHMNIAPICTEAMNEDAFFA